MKIIVADISSFSHQGKIIGHWAETAKMYEKILKDSFDVLIAGSSLYEQNDYRHLIELPKGVEVFHELTLLEKINKVFVEVSNCKKVLNENADVILFQSSGFRSMLLTMLLMNKRKIGDKRIYFIQYANQCKNKFDQFLWKHVKSKFAGMITSTDKVGISYGIKYLSIPDYVYVAEPPSDPIPQQFAYDFCMVGTMNSAKDIEMIVDVFKKRPECRVMIAGHFSDKERFKSLKAEATENISIENKYLTNDEYDQIIRTSKFCLLPYKSDYESTTSGVIYDYLFRMRPVIYRDIANFAFVKEKEVGFSYKYSVEEVFSSLENVQYERIMENIRELIHSNMKAAKLVTAFLKEEL